MKRTDPAKTFLLSILAAASCSPPLMANAAKPVQRREQGALYLTDVSARPCHLRIVGDAPVYAGADGGKPLPSKLSQGGFVELIAVSESNDLLWVREDGKPDGAAVWVSGRQVTPLDARLIAAIRLRLARREQVRALAARREIALNMTRREIIDILDNPFKRLPVAKDGTETWEYPFYVRMPRLISQEDYSRSAQAVGFSMNVQRDRMQDGTILVTFTKDLVSAVTYRDVPHLKPGDMTAPKAVPPPLVLR